MSMHGVITTKAHTPASSHKRYMGIQVHAQCIFISPSKFMQTP